LANTNENNAGQSEQYVPQSNDAIYESFGGWDNFMNSYGLKPWDDDDIKDGMAIVEAIREGDKSDWEEGQKRRQARNDFCCTVSKSIPNYRACSSRSVVSLCNILPSAT
jgi:hypothetical protein